VAVPEVLGGTDRDRSSTGEAGCDRNERGGRADVARAGSVLMHVRGVDRALGLLPFAGSVPARELPAHVRGRDQDDTPSVEQAVDGGGRRVGGAEGGGTLKT